MHNTISKEKLLETLEKKTKDNQDKPIGLFLKVTLNNIKKAILQERRNALGLGRKYDKSLYAMIEEYKSMAPDDDRGFGTHTRRQDEYDNLSFQPMTADPKAVQTIIALQNQRTPFPITQSTAQNIEPKKTNVIAPNPQRPTFLAIEFETTLDNDSKSAKLRSDDICH